MPEVSPTAAIAGIASNGLTNASSNQPGPKNTSTLTRRPSTTSNAAAPNIPPAASTGPSNPRKSPSSGRSAWIRYDDARSLPAARHARSRAEAGSRRRVEPEHADDVRQGARRLFRLVERAGKSALLPRRRAGAPRRTGKQGIRSLDHQPALSRD